MTNAIGSVGESRAKDSSIQGLRGLAVLLMVAGHVIGSSGDRGMNVLDDSGWRVFYLLLEDIRMPLFTVISGYVYAMRPVTGSSGARELFRGKVRRLLLPLLTVGTLLFATKVIVPDTNATPELSGFWRIFLFGYEHLWFLQAIFLIFLAVGTLGVFKLLDTPMRWTVVLGTSVVAFVLFRFPEAANFFSINGAIRLLPFFLLGYGLYRFRFAAPRSWRLVLCIATFCAAYLIRVFLVLKVWDWTPLPERVVSLFIGLTAITLLYCARRVFDLRWIAWIGGFSFGVYLLHVFGSAGARTLLGKFGIEEEFPVFLICLGFGVLVPILVQLSTTRIRFVHTFAFGEKWPSRTASLSKG